jgi:hypothetical protein
VRVPGVCAWPVVGQPSLLAVAAKNPPRFPACRAHDSRRHLVRLVPPVPGLWLCFTHTSCVCNDLISAVNRVCSVVPRPDPAAVKLMYRTNRRLARAMGHFAPYTYDQVLATFGGKQRKRYADAVESLKLQPLTRRDARVSAFVKSEKFNPLAKRNPDPRMIQARQPRYGVEIARYLKPIEKALYTLRGPTGLRCIAKGLNQRQRAELLLLKLQQFRNPVILGLDCAKFDKHVDVEQLKVEHAFYLMLCSSPHFQTLLSWQLVNEVVTSNGVRYTIYGKRMSGEMNTALGNCTLMVNMSFTSMSVLKIPNSGWDLLDDGDDCLLIVEAQYLDLVLRELPKLFLRFGHELKIELVTRDIRRATFCQSRVVCLADGPLFVRDWRKVLSQSACGVKHWGVPNMVRPMLTAVGACELALSLGVPILQEWAVAMIRNGRGLRPKVLDIDSGLAARVKYEVGAVDLDVLLAVQPSVIRDCDRVAFADTWGTCVEEQLRVEAILRNWHVDSVEAVTYPTEWFAPEWVGSVALENDLPLI